MTSRRKVGDDDGQMEKLIEKNEEGRVTTGSPPSDASKDRNNIFLLLFLYVLQGIPLGLAASIPMILQTKGISFKDQATFSLSFWPFSIKLLWAPIVDSCFFQKMGRRKSWLVPAQYLIGIFMLFLSYKINTLLGVGDDAAIPNVPFITCVFFALNFLAATQDIAVDGWALTILSRENVGWASTCNSVGQTAGFFLGYVVFLALESRDFCLNYLGRTDSLVTLPGFLYFWGIVFLVTTSLVWLLKRETDSGGDNEEPNFGLIGTYMMLLRMLNMKSVRSLILILLTCKIGFAAADSLTVLKLTEAGVPKDRLALLSIPLTPVQVFLPLYISRFTAGAKPMDVFLLAMPIRLLFGMVFAGLVYVTPYFADADGLFPFHYYIIIVIIYLIHQVTANCMFVAVMSFFARISDPSVGGTYMTMLNTFTNLGGNWPAWIALRFVSELTWKTCSGAAQVLLCNTKDQEKECQEDGGSCSTEIDGYYVESVVFMVLGLLWLNWGMPLIRKLQALPTASWLVISEPEDKED